MSKTTKTPKHLKEVIEAFDLPKRLKHESINLFPNLKPLNTLATKNLFIYGKSGTGKTINALNTLIHIALSTYPKGPKEDKDFLKKLYFEDFQCAYVNVPELLNHIRNSIKSNETDDLISKYKQVDYLILDDIGVEKQSPWVYEILYLLVNYRYNEYKYTIVTSNVDPQKLIDKFGDDRIISRIMDNSELVHKTKNWRVKK